MLILMAGLPGTGKTTLACVLSQRTGGHVLDKDAVRKAIFAPRQIEYSTEQDDLVVRLMLQAAAWLLRNDSTLHIFLDGRVFSRSTQIDEVVEFAAKVRTSWRIVECVCSEQTARARLEHDCATGAHAAANRDFALYLEVKQRFEPITRDKIIIDTEQTLEMCADQTLKGIL